MFNLGISEIVLISIIALIFIGPKQLPEIARALGRALNELKRASEDLTSSLTNPKNYHEDKEFLTHQKHQTDQSSFHSPPNEIVEIKPEKIKESEDSQQNQQNLSPSEGNKKADS